MFVTFEGPEGAGKSTAVSGLADWLRVMGKDVLITREPGSGEIGGAIRKILLEGGEVPPVCELFLFLADRAQHVANIVRPALVRGTVVLCDRYADSTVVYQGYGRGLDLERLRDWNRYATGGLVPDLTLLLDVDPVVGIGRLGSADRIDGEPIAFHETIRRGFLTEASLEPQRWRTIDAGQDPERVLTACQDALSEALAV
ncbi:MAG: dTMP kinase [Armatimonadetes bacterium]|nr:dTMP kinase [Armatimonadota bacterium]